MPAILITSLWWSRYCVSTVMSGVFYIGIGEQFDRGKMEAGWRLPGEHCPASGCAVKAGVSKGAATCALPTKCS